VCIVIFGYLLELVENLAVFILVFWNFDDFIFQKSLNLQQKYFKEFFNSTEIWHQKKRADWNCLGCLNIRLGTVGSNCCRAPPTPKAKL
jgi:hypothetical protein